VCCSVLQRINSVLQCVALSFIHIVTTTSRVVILAYFCNSVLQCVACVAVCCSVLQCVAVCCSVLRCVAVDQPSSLQLASSCVDTCDTPRL